METNTTTSTIPGPNPGTFARQLPLAMQALGLHMEANNLPPFWTIDIRDQHILVHLPRGTHDAWLTTVVVDDEHSEDRHPGGVDAIRTEWEVRLPDTGFRFTLVSYRVTPAWKPAVAS